MQVLYKILKSERVSERNKQRIKLKDFGYLGLVCFHEDIPVTMTTVRCLYEQVLATGNVEPAVPGVKSLPGWERRHIKLLKYLNIVFDLEVIFVDYDVILGSTLSMQTKPHDSLTF